MMHKFSFAKEIEDRKIIRCRFYTFESPFCWVCGAYTKAKGKIDDTKATMHHLIPKCLNPLNNVVVPICWKCHRLIHGHIKFVEEEKNEVQEVREVLQR